ncbi:hypothetical protein PR048_015316 [Dryococelus australis]|uniref:Uncharacterized protein n=1 Tax=Dryococelus australis TaxID=614101 RepID=A0ABQ9HGM9_9NEOP|nr:hypothetical protein PR048_015316 [Dryococelus australis]
MREMSTVKISTHRWRAAATAQDAEKLRPLGPYPRSAGGKRFILVRRIGKESAMAFVKDPHHHSPGVISGTMENRNQDGWTGNRTRVLMNAFLQPNTYIHSQLGYCPVASSLNSPSSNQLLFHSLPEFTNPSHRYQFLPQHIPLPHRPHKLLSTLLRSPPHPLKILTVVSSSSKHPLTSVLVAPTTYSHSYTSSPMGAFCSHSLWIKLYKSALTETLYGVGLRLRLWSLRKLCRDASTRSLTCCKDGRCATKVPLFQNGFNSDSTRDGMAAQDLLSDARRHLHRALQQVHQRMPIRAIQAVHVLLARHRRLGEVLAQLDAWPALDLHHLVDAAQRRLALARYQVRAHTEAVYRVALLIEADDGLLVYVVGGDDGETVLAGDGDETLAADDAEVSQVATIYADAHSTIAQIVESHGHSTEVEQAALPHVVGVYERHEASGEGASVSDPCGQLAVRGFGSWYVQHRATQLLPPVHAQLQQVARLTAATAARRQHLVGDLS